MFFLTNTVRLSTLYLSATEAQNFTPNIQIYAYDLIFIVRKKRNLRFLRNNYESNAVEIHSVYGCGGDFA